MSAEIKVPQLGESVVEATVGRWLKGEGDAVTAGDPVVELETDKVNVEVPSTADGTLQSIVKPEGETVSVGDVLALVDEAGAGDGATPEKAQEPAPQQPQAGAQAASPATQPESRPAEVSEEEETEGEAGSSRATPLARRIAAEHGIDIGQIKGTGPGGRVKRDDVAAYLERQPASRSQAGEARQPQAASAPAQPATLRPETLGPAATALPTPETGGRWEERVRMSRRRQTIAQRLVEAQHAAAMLTTFNEVNMTAVMEIRRRRREAFEKRHGVRLGFMSFFTRAVIGALKAFPRLNAEIQGEEMILKHYYDIGIAVGTEEGLVVPVVRDADRKTFAELEREIADLAEKARNRSLTLEELQGGTFTITNGGIYGSLLSTPILNGPQVGILGMHKIEERPVALSGEVVIRPMMYLALSYDHRIVDGSEAVQFLVHVKELIEDPETLLLEG
jgi:2-oxoglutarate dehydrogenase E2 component (dihydrolipoamide succinyltransferase)